MNKNIFFSTFFVLFFLLSCNKRKIINIKNLNGYWEIEKAIAPTGEEKKYNISKFVEFIQLTSDSTGFRTKLKPSSFKGNFESNFIKQKFKIIELEENNFNLKYNLNNFEWTEKLIEASKNNFTVQHENGVLYTYKIYTPIIIE